MGTPLTLRIGLFAGIVGIVVGATLAFVSGYYGGIVDNVIKGIVDVGLTIPGLLILIIIGMNVRGGLTVNQMALVVSLLAWLYPARTIRSQVLTLKQRGYVQVARLSGMSSPEIIIKELMPNLLPYLGASFVGAVSAGILAAIGLEVLGLGPFEAPTLGMTIYWINYNAAIINGWWWWWVPPIVVIDGPLHWSVPRGRRAGRNRQSPGAKPRLSCRVPVASRRRQPRVGGLEAHPPGECACDSGNWAVSGKRLGVVAPVVVSPVLTPPSASAVVGAVACRHAVERGRAEPGYG